MNSGRVHSRANLLRDAIRIVDELGYNAIDFRVLNFRPTTADQAGPGQDIRGVLSYFEPAEYWETPQIKAWKKAAAVDLTTSGGHDAQFTGRLVCPVQFLLRHYPIRNQAQGERKIFEDRLPRFLDAERKAGWHVQYDGIATGDSLLRDPSTLARFDEESELQRLRVSHRDTPTLEATAQRLTAAEADAARLSDEASRLAAALDSRTAELEALQRHLEGVREHARLERDAHRRHSDNMRDLLLASQRSATDAAVHHEAALHTLQSELAAIYRSKSWKWTTPLRWAYGLAASSRSAPPVVPPPVPDRIGWGDLDTVSPISKTWGLDRGQPIDRYFIEEYLRQHAADIRGTAFEIKDAGYTRMFGAGRVTRTIVVDVDAANDSADLRADLTASDHFPAAAADCFVLTQTIHIIFDYAAALRTAMRVLKPGGVLLCTIPAVSRVNYENGGLESGDFWRMTRAAVARTFEELDDVASFEITTYGNVKTCAAFLYGLATEDLAPATLDFHDPWFPLLHGVRAIRKS